MKKIFYVLFYLLVVALLPESAGALERFDLVTTREMTKLLQEREAGLLDFVLVNSLDEMIFREGHIPGSISIPLGRINEYLHRLGDDKNRLIITY